MTKQEIDELLSQAGVFNEFTHCEDGVPVTYITSREEIEKFVDLVYELAYDRGRDREFLDSIGAEY